MKKQLKPNTGNKIVALSLLVIAIAVLISFFPLGKSNFKNSNQPTNQISRQNCLAEDCLLVDGLTYPAGELPQTVVDSLNAAINDEYKAYSTYNAVISKFGNIRPFSMIIRAEEQHISSLKSIYDKYGLVPPVNQLKVVAPATLSLACQTGVEAEIANAALYRDNLLPAVSQYPDITQVFTSLMNASQQKHLPAFQKCQ